MALKTPSKPDNDRKVTTPILARACGATMYTMTGALGVLLLLMQPNSNQPAWMYWLPFGTIISILWHLMLGAFAYQQIPWAPRAVLFTLALDFGILATFVLLRILHGFFG